TGGQTPFRATSLFQLAEDLLCKPPDLSALESEQSPVLHALDTAFNKDPMLRQLSCSEFVEALKDEPVAPSKIYYRVSFLLFILLLIALTVFWTKKTPTQQSRGSYKEEYQLLNNEIQRFQTKVLPEHFYQHLIKNLDSDHKDCVASKKLYHKVIRLKNEMTQLGLSSKKLAKRTDRWTDFLSFVEIIEKVDPSSSIVNPNTDIQRQLRAHQLLMKKSRKAADFLKFKPDHPAWLKSWLLLRIKIATRQKLYAQSLDYLQQMKKAFPEETRFEGDIWFAKAKVAGGRGISDEVQKFKALFAYWKYQQLQPRFKIPDKFQFGLNSKGQLDVLRINKALDKLRFKKPKLVFRITLEAANHGIYTDSLDSFRHRKIIQSLGLPDKFARQEPESATALFWKAYAPLLSSPDLLKDQIRDRLLNLRENLDAAFVSSQPSFYLAILHSHRANILCELIATFPAEFNKPELCDAALSDLKRALQYPHPKPHIVYWLRFRLLLLSCQSIDDALEKETEILQCLEQYLVIFKKYYEEPVTRRNKNLSVGRPRGIPRARFTDVTYDEFKTKYYGGRMSYYIAAEKWKKAKEASDKLLYLTTNPISYDPRIRILTRLGDFEQLRLLKKRLLRDSKSSALTKKRDVPILMKLVFQIDQILASQRRR
ncbi:MAG: hypothetical protein P1V97_12155, partial [Planctomycetota bacterium]|nr:hypothetical protein [Planctomycetota bacterium]